MLLIIGIKTTLSDIQNLTNSADNLLHTMETLKNGIMMVTVDPVDRTFSAVVRAPFVVVTLSAP